MLVAQPQFKYQLLHTRKTWDLFFCSYANVDPFLARVFFLQLFHKYAVLEPTYYEQITNEVSDSDSGD
jgi:hypothetical protein